MMRTNNDTARTLVLATDGACLGNPGPGGWAVVIRERDSDNHVRRSAIAGCAEGDTTNNRQELQAAIEALRYAREASYTEITIFTDSQYVTKGVTQYLPSWKANGWRKSDRKPVLNRDLWETLDALLDGLEVRWEWTRGHAGHPLNDLADKVAGDAARGVHGGDPEELRGLYPEAFADG